MNTEQIVEILEQHICLTPSPDGDVLVGIHEAAIALRNQLAPNEQNPLIQKINKYISEQENLVNCHYATDDLSKRIQSIVNIHISRATTATVNAKALIEDMRVYLRAIQMVAESAANGGTHRENGARSRGLIQMIEGTIEKLSRMEIDTIRVGYESIFRSEYPIRELLYKYNNQQFEYDSLKKKADMLEKLLIEKGVKKDDLPF